MDDEPVGPQVGTSVSDFFQSDRDLAAQKRREAKIGNKSGDPIRIASKVLCLILTNGEDREAAYAYVGDSGFLARKINLSTGKTVKIFKGHSGPVTCVGIWRDKGNEHLITGSWDKTLIKWDTKTKNPQQTFTSHKDFVKCLAIAYTSSTLFSGSSDKEIRSWNLQTGELLPLVMKGHTRGIEDLLFDQEEKFLYSASSDGHIRKWNPVTGECLQVYEGHLTSIYALQVFDEEMWSVSADMTAKRWDLATGKVDTTFTHPDVVKCQAIFEPFLITGGRDETIRVFEIGTGNFVKEIEGHFDEVSCMAIKGTTLYTGSLDCTIRRWSISADIAASTVKGQTLDQTEAKAHSEFEAPNSMLTEEEEKELAELMDSD